MRLRKLCCAALLMLGILAILSGCGEHEHTFSKWSVTKKPGCVDAGVQSRECSECGYVQSESIAAVGHTTVKDPIVKATCTEDGLTEGSHCSVCGEVLLAQEAIPAFGHAELIDYEVKATCTQNGLTEGKHCALCGVVTVPQETVESTGHQYDEGSVVTPANCMQLGTKRYRCLFCDTSYLDTYSTTEHTVVVDAAVPAGCLTDGLTEGSHCGVCNLVFAEQVVVPATGHAPVTDAAVEVTCTTDGLTEGSHCANCGEIMLAQETIPALGHQDEVVILQEATCKAAGTRQATCLVCGDVRQETYELPVYTDMDLYNAAVQYVADIVTYDKNGNAYGGGIGFVLTSDGKIVTNYQTIVGAYSARVTVNGVSYDVKLVLSYSEAMDLAVLKVDATDLVPAKICAEQIADGETVYALAVARSLENTYIQGVAAGEILLVDGIPFVRHDATVTDSNAGGPLLNLYGEVIGINSYILSQNNNMNVAVFATALDMLDYSSSATLEQLYQQTTPAYQKLVDSIFANGTKDSFGNVIVYGSRSTADCLYVYELVYDAQTGGVWIKQSSTSSNGQKVETQIWLTGEAGPQKYTCTFIIGSNPYNTITGNLDAETYTNASTLTYETYEGMVGFESTLMNMYEPSMDRTLEWLSGYLTRSVGITMADIGFLAYGN